MNIHPGDALDGEIMAMFPSATLVDDDGPPWRTVVEGRYGKLAIRDVPDDGEPGAAS